MGAEIIFDELSFYDSLLYESEDLKNDLLNQEIDSLFNNEYCYE